MPVLISVLVLVGALCTLDLILTVGVVKRLREHGELLSSQATNGPRSSIQLGEQVGEFTAHTVDGEPVGRDMMTGETLVGFFTPNCGPCKELLPRFVEHARTMPGGRARVLATVVGEAEQVRPMIDELRAVAQVVAQTRNEEAVGLAFEIMAFPTVLKVMPDTDGRVVVTSDSAHLSLPEVPVRVP
ncbi:redoxin domain-containing protein [Streptomyces olivoreticuli]|uniref:redoxin domain-containing protein n=1 Tax=Streptomyces olivoreticuli TaxID=68246 RepID=UPI000E25C10D|nr:redoxin domain-containing protein [Streptomyces olivoreticuli]